MDAGGDSSLAADSGRGGDSSLVTEAGRASESGPAAESGRTTESGLVSDSELGAETTRSSESGPSADAPAVDNCSTAVVGKSPSPASVPNTHNLHFLGQHFHNLCQYPSGAAGPTVFPPKDKTTGAPVVGLARTWDSGTGTWSQVQKKSRDTYNWAALDCFVNAALANGAQVLHTFGGDIPTWASARPTEYFVYTTGGAAEPANIEDWKTYLRALFTRYKGRIRYYEVWNEPDFRQTPGDFYTGTAAKLFELHKAAYLLLKQIDPEAQLLGPGFVSPGSFSAYLDAAGSEFTAYTDAVAYHFYAQNPEFIPSIRALVTKTMESHGVFGLPVFNTESGYAAGDPAAGPLPVGVPSLASYPGWLARSYIWGMYSGLQSFAFYPYDNALIPFYQPNGQLNDRGLAQVQIAKWLTGATLGDCFHLGSTVYACDVQRTGAGLAKLVWRADDAKMNFPIPSDWSAVAETEDLVGKKTNVVGATTLAITGLPILVKSKAAAWDYDASDPVATYHPRPTYCTGASATAYAAQVKAERPVAYYRLGTLEGWTLADASGNGRDALASTQSTAVLVDGALFGDSDRALDFQGASPEKAISVTVPTSVDVWRGNFTLEFWANVADFSGANNIAFAREVYLKSGFRFGPVRNDSQNLWQFWTSESGGNVELRSKVPLAQGEWTHVALTHDATTNQFSMYVNGRLDGAQTGSTFVAPTGGLVVGSYGGHALNGRLDEVAVYDRVLAADTLRLHYQSGSNFCHPTPIVRAAGTYAAAVKSDRPLAYYPFAKGGNGPLSDVSGNGRHATFVGPGAGPATLPIGALFRDDDGALSLGGSTVESASSMVVPEVVNPWSGDFSVEFWARVDDFGGLGQTALAQGAFSQSGFRLGPAAADGGGSGHWVFWTSENGGSMAHPTTAVVRAGEWNHLVVTYTKSAHELRLYVNGALDSMDDTGVFVPPAGGLRLGHEGCHYFQGALDEVAIYDQALSVHRIRQHYLLGSNQ